VSFASCLRQGVAQFDEPGLVDNAFDLQNGTDHGSDGLGERQGLCVEGSLAASLEGQCTQHLAVV